MNELAELALFAQYDNNNLIAWWFILFSRTLQIVTGTHYRLSTELLTVCKVALQCLSVTLHVLQFWTGVTPAILSRDKVAAACDCAVARCDFAA